MKRFLAICSLVGLTFCQANLAPAQIRTDLMPNVVELSDSAMRALYCPTDLPDGYVCDTPVALYSKGTIYVPKGYIPTTPRAAGLLLHEFTHHLQWLIYRGENEPCLGYQERQAYGVQERWLDENGLKPDTEVDFPGPLKRMMLESQGCL